MDNNDVRTLCNAFITLCNHIEYSDNSCSICPLREKICFNKNKGTEFWDKINRELDTKKNTYLVTRRTMATYYKTKTIPVSKYGDIPCEEFGIKCTYCYAGEKTFESEKGELTVSEHYNPSSNYVTVRGTIDGEKVFKSFECSYGFWAGCDYAKDLLKTKDVKPIVKPAYEQ